MNTPVSDLSRTAVLIEVHNPFDVSDQSREIVPLSEDVKVRELIPVGKEHLAVSINGEIIEVEDYDTRRVIEGDYVVLCPVPTGSGGGKNILRIVALIAVAVAAPWAAAALPGLTTAAGALTFAGYGVAAGFAVAGSLIVNALIPIETSLPNTASKLQDSSPSYGIDGAKNTAREGIPVPVVYGDYRVAGNLINIYTQNVDEGDTQDLYMLFAISEGPIGAILEDTIYVDDQPIANFDQFVVDSRLGYDNQTPMDWFADTIVPNSVGITLTTDWTEYTTVTSIDRFRVDIVAPQGWRQIANDGSSLWLEQDISIEYRKSGNVTWETLEVEAFVDFKITEYVYTHDINGTRYAAPLVESAIRTDTFLDTDGSIYVIQLRNTSDWKGGSSTSWDTWTSGGSTANWKPGDGNTNPPALTHWKTGEPLSYTRKLVVGYKTLTPVYSNSTEVSGAKTSAFRLSYQSTNMPDGRGIYDIRVRRNVAESADAKVIDKLVWSDLNEIQSADVTYKHTALLGIKIRLTDQLNSRPNITSRVRGVQIRQPKGDYEPGFQWEYATSSNPAWIALDMLTNTRYGAGYSDDRIDMFSLFKWAIYCDEQNLTFNGIFDADMNFWDALMYVMRVGHAKPTPMGMKMGFAVERAENPVMMFNVSNMKRGTLSIDWLPMSDRANEIEVTYYPRLNANKQSVLKVVDTQAQAGTVPRVARLNMVGVTEDEQARREAQLLLNMNKYIQQTATWESALEAIACKVGDLVLVQHDVPEWNYGGRTKAGSTTTVIELDRPVTMQANTNYTLMLNFDHLQVSTGTVTTKIDDYNLILSDQDYRQSGLHRIFIGGQEYTVTSMFATYDGFGVTTEEPMTTVAALDAYTLHRLDALESRLCTQLLSTQEVTQVTLATPMPQAPGQYVKWLFGPSSVRAKPFRVMGISGNGVHERTITALEYNDDVYYEDNLSAEPPVYTLPNGVTNVTSLTATQISKPIGTVVSPVIRLEWQGGSNYRGADIFVQRFNGSAKFAGSVRDGATAFDFTDFTVGETLSFKVAAVDSVGARAPLTSAPTVTIAIVAAGEILAAPTNAAATFVSTGIALTWTNSDEPNFLETEVWHHTADDVNSAVRIYRGAQETFTHTGAGATNYYWLRTINSDKVPSVYTATLTPAGLGQVQNLVLKSAFTGDAAEIVWDVVPGAATYTVEVRTKSTLRRSQTVSLNAYRYSVEDAIADGDVDRDITFTVKAVAVDGSSGPTQTLAVNNPAPALPTNLSVSPGFKQMQVEFTPPSDPDFTEVVLWVGTVSGFTPSDVNKVATIKGGPIVIGNLSDDTDYYMRLTCRDVWGNGITSAEYNIRTLDVTDFGLSAWAYVTTADRTFIEANLSNDAIPSEKIVSITASRITTGTLAATEKISVEGQIESIIGSINVTMGPKTIGAKVALFSIMNGPTVLMRVNEDGTSEFTGAMTISGGSSGYVNLGDKPASLNDISTADENRLTQAEQDAAQALTDASNAQSTADGKITTFYQATAPTATGVGDLWFETDNNNKCWRWDGAAWVDAQDGGIQNALNAAATADAKADGKVTTFFSSTTPTAEALGDLWYNDSNKLLKRWDGTVWFEVANYVTGTSQLTDDAGLAGADWSATLANIPNRLTNTPTAGLNLTDTYLGYYDGAVWGTFIKNDGSFFFGSQASGQYLTFDPGVGVLQLGPKTNIGSNDDRNVTVGATGDFATLNEALEFLSRTVPAYKLQGFQAIITIQSGTVINEQIHCIGVDLSWIRIEAVDAEVFYDSTGFISYGPQFQTVDTFILAAAAGRSPVIATSFTQTAGTKIYGVVAMDGGVINIDEDSSQRDTTFKGFLTGAYAKTSGKVKCFNDFFIEESTAHGIYVRENGLIEVARSLSCINNGANNVQMQSNGNITVGASLTCTSFSPAPAPFACISVSQSTIFVAGSINADTDVASYCVRSLSAARVRAGALILATGASVRGVQATAGSEIIAASVINSRKGATDSSQDTEILSGSVIRRDPSSTGGTNVTPNTVSSNGIIYQ